MTPSDLSKEELLELHAKRRIALFSQGPDERMRALGSLGVALCEALGKGAEEMSFETGVGHARSRMSFDGPAGRGKAGELVGLGDWLGVTRQMIAQSDGDPSVFFTRSIYFQCQLPFGSGRLRLSGATRAGEGKRTLVVLSLEIGDDDLEALRAELERSELRAGEPRSSDSAKAPTARL